jgi:hypothetical protein
MDNDTMMMNDVDMPFLMDTGSVVGRSIIKGALSWELLEAPRPWRTMLVATCKRDDGKVRTVHIPSDLAATWHASNS